MATEVFDRLVVSLKQSERDELLGRLSQQSDLSMEPLYQKSAEDKPRNIEEEYGKLPFLLRIWYFLLGIFFSKPPAKTYEDSLIAKIGRGINQDSPGYYQYTQALLLPQMCQSLVDLKESVRFFYNALDMSVNKDKGAFYAFMASFEMPEIHNKLSLLSCAEEFARESPGVNMHRLKQMAVDQSAECFAAIDAAQRERMYRNVRSLICLKELSAFLFDRLITAFQFDTTHQGNTCSAAAVKGQLSALNDILYSMREVPSSALLSTLFIFSLHEQFENDNGRINSELQQLLAKTEKSLTIIRTFNRMVPLTLILRCANKNMSYEPRELSGGEDWFSVFRNYWKDKLEDVYHDYVIAKKQQEIQNAFEVFFGGAELTKMEGIDSDDDADRLPLENTLMLSFIQTFYKRIFLAEMNQVLRPILIDGDFVKKENRTAFAEAYNELIKVDDLVAALLKKTAPLGDYGKRFHQIKMDVVSPPIRHRKMQILREDLHTESTNIIDHYRDSLESMNAVIIGILRPVDDGPYNTLHNLSQMMGKSNREFMETLHTTSEKLKLAVDLVENISDVESEG